MNYKLYSSKISTNVGYLSTLLVDESQSWHYKRGESLTDFMNKFYINTNNYKSYKTLTIKYAKGTNSLCCDVVSRSNNVYSIYFYYYSGAKDIAEYHLRGLQECIKYIDKYYKLQIML